MTQIASTLLCAGGAALAVQFTDAGGDPLKDFPELRWSGRPYAEGLAEAVLDPFLALWTVSDEGHAMCREGEPVPERRRRLRGAVEAAMDQCVAAFREAEPQRATEEDHTVLAALTVTANLQRTLLRLAELLGRPADTSASPTELTLSRPWCGLIPKPKRPPPGAAMFLRPLSRALGCSPGEIDARCREALIALRTDLRRGTLLAREDLARRPSRVLSGS